MIYCNFYSRTKSFHNFQKIIREHVCRGKYKLAERPDLRVDMLVLDMTNAEVREYLFNAMSAVLKSADISYVILSTNKIQKKYFVKTIVEKYNESYWNCQKNR